MGELACGACIVGWIMRALISGVRAIFFGALD